MEKLCLSDINPSERVLILENNVKGNNKHHLETLGIIRGEKIVCLFKSIFNNPVAYLVKNTIVAIRESDAKNIIVYKEDEDGSF